MKTTVMQIRMDEELRNQTADVLDNIGMDIPTAVRVFFKRIVAERGIPFEMREPRATYRANPGWAAFEDLRIQAQKGSAAGMSGVEIDAEIAAHRAGK
ncbi:MAG: type II toxin-antitoxin system RelB/DinJ family antitoxin [Fibrobacter sp.]|nr:type II toxin-antitoxin system RelB/DinJ family antitoxin [Fibrobacter sp.]